MRYRWPFAHMEPGDFVFVRNIPPGAAAVRAHVRKSQTGEKYATKSGRDVAGPYLMIRRLGDDGTPVKAPDALVFALDGLKDPDEQYKEWGRAAVEREGARKAAYIRKLFGVE